MAPRKAPTKPLEYFYDLKSATVRLGLAPEDPENTDGQRWLRDGVNKKGWPCHRMGGRLMFSDSNLAVIADYCSNPATRPGRKSASAAA